MDIYVFVDYSVISISLSTAASSGSGGGGGGGGVVLNTYTPSLSRPFIIFS